MDYWPSTSQPSRCMKSGQWSVNGTDYQSAVDAEQDTATSPPDVVHQSVSDQKLYVSTSVLNLTLSEFQECI